jgi:hypothetical protein
MGDRDGGFSLSRQPETARWNGRNQGTDLHRQTIGKDPWVRSESQSEEAPEESIFL